MKSLKSVKRFQEAIVKAFEASMNVSGTTFETMKSVVNPEYIKKIEWMTPFFDVRDIVKEEVAEEKEDTDVSNKTISVGVEVSPSEPPAPLQKGWLKYKPDIPWELDKGNSLQRYKAGLMVSREGDVWDILHNKLLPHKFSGCEVKVVLEKDCFDPPETVDKILRVAPMVQRLFGVSPTVMPKKNEKVVIDYIDGDRRNLRPENLKWVSQKKPLDKAKILADDVCRRLVENNGDVEKTLECYCESTITSKYISNIRFKLIETTLSDKYFKVDKSGNFTPVVSNDKTKKEQSKKSVSPKKEMPQITSVPDDILASHIRSGKLTIAEKNLMLIKAINTLKDEKVKNITPEAVVDLVRDHYKISLPTDMAQNLLGGMRI